MHLKKQDPDNPTHSRLRLKESKYAADLSTPLPGEFDKLYHKIVEDTYAKDLDASMMVTLSQAQFLHQMVQILRPSHILEIGSFTGGSAVAMGSALGPHGKLLSLDINLEALKIAKNNVESSSLREKITFKHGHASDSITELVQKTPRPQFDFIFIDADKRGYINYYNLIMEHNLLSDNGIILADNVLFLGQVHREAGYEEQLNYELSQEFISCAKALNIFNKHVQQDPRVEVVILPIFDGVSLIRKRSTSTTENFVTKNSKL